MKKMIKLALLSALVTLSACSGQGSSSSSWRDNPQYRYDEIRRDGDSLYMRGPRSRAEYDAWERERYHDYRTLQREQQLQDRGRLDNSTDSGRGLGNPVSF